MAHSQSRLVWPALLLTLALLLAACTTPEIIRETPQPNATETPPPQALATESVATATAVVESPRRHIERIAIATSIGDDGAPVDERSVVPEGAERFYLCVLVREVKQGTNFRAIWFEGGQIIGQSDKLALEDAPESVWIPLFYRPVAKLNPAAEHAVELIVDDETVERLAFRVGVGDAADAIAAAAFTTGFDYLGKAISPQTRFHVSTPQLTLRVRISNQVDPSGMIFSTLWYRGDTQIRQQPPDPPEPAPQGTPTPDPRRLAFTFVPSSPLTPGDYRVALLLNGTEVRSISFVVTEDAVATTPTVSATPAPTGTSRPGASTATPASAEVVDLVVTTRVDSATQAPLDGPIFEWDAEPDAVVVLWVAISVRNVQASDTLELVVLQNDEFYGSVPFSSTTLSSSWLAGRVELVAPAAGDEPITYLFSTRLNDSRALETALQLSSGE